MELKDWEFPIGRKSTLDNKTGSWRNIRPVIREKAAPCIKACPISNRIPHYFESLLDNELEKAAEILLETNPLPSVTGRACIRPCEVGCNRRRFDEAISIARIERFVGDYSLKKRWKPPKEETGKKVIIVGSGPAGLTAAFFLRKKGHKVTILERSSKVGGMLIDAIPSYRLPVDIVEAEIEAILGLGIEVRTGVELGKDFEVEELLATYDAVFVATGAHKERNMKIEGEEILLSGLNLLKEIKSGKVEWGWKKAAVIGGGNVAMDVARSLLRIGVEPCILYRRTRKEMPAIEEEIEKAIEDGIEIKYLTLPIKASRKNGKVLLRCIKMKLGEPDSSGRRRPIPIEGSEFEMEFDAVVKAIGEIADTSFLPEEVKDRDGWVVSDKRTAATPIKGLFAGGDLVDGPSVIVQAMAWGKKAARSIDLYLRGEDYTKFEVPLPTVPFSQIQIEYFEKKKRVKERTIEPKERVKSIEREENLGYNKEEVLEECARCFSCGHCNKCGNCWVFCPDNAVDWNGSPSINYEYCKGCGICSAECPRGIISLETERIG